MSDKCNNEKTATGSDCEKPVVRRMGRFRIPMEIIDQKPEDVMDFMREMVVVRCELRYDVRAFEYTVIGNVFDVVEECREIPFYDLEMETVTVGEGEDAHAERRLKRVVRFA